MIELIQLVNISNPLFNEYDICLQAMVCFCVVIHSILLEVVSFEMTHALAQLCPA